jgi:hypothetical protein
MSIFSRVALAGVVCAALSAQAVAAPTGDDPGTTRGRLLHAGKCVVTLGFSGGCDKDESDSKRVAEERKAAAEHPETIKAVDEHSTRHQLAHASECVVSFGFFGGCDKDAPSAGSAAAASSRHEDAAPRAPDTSTAGQFKRASGCVVTFGLLGDCDKK